MHLKEKINLTKYFLLMSGSFMLTLVFIRSWFELLGLLCCYLGIVINHGFHIYGGYQLVEPSEGGVKKSTIFFLLSKLLILGFFLYISVQILEKKIFIPVTVYLFMLFTFSITLNKDTKKGLE